MNDDLKDFIRNNREAFDHREPDPGIWERIQNDVQNAPDIKPAGSGRNLWPHFWRAAAILLFGLSVYLFATRGQVVQKGDAMADLPSEIVEAEAFYTAEIARKRQLIASYTLNEPELKNQFSQELEYLDSLYANLKQELDTVQNQRVMDAMILNLQTRIEILNRQLGILQQLKEKEHETSVHI